MKVYDVFNGDADGICALLQLRRAEPIDSVLVTGVKRDIQLLAQLDVDEGDHVNALDISMDKNKQDLLRILASGASVFYCDHHAAGDIPEHPRLQTLVNPAADVCTSLLINGHLEGRYRHWAIVGSGGNVIAAEEIRIKLSELCYKSIASDVIEDKKHIDLSSEPMILVCANGITGSTVDDIAKEVAIFRAHKAAPIVITDSEPNKFPDALDVIPIPPTHPDLAFILATMAGHLFGYEAACSIDSQAQPLRVAHAVIENLTNDRLTANIVTPNDEVFDYLREDIRKVSNFFFDELRNGRLNGHLEASTSVRLASLLRYSLGEIPLDLYQIEFGRVGTPSLVIDELAKALVLAIEELTRPVDAIKHQAKTVTVGISRSDENLLNISLVKRVLETGTSRDSISYETLKLLVSLDLAIDEVIGHTRYRISGLDGDKPTLTILDRAGVSVGIQSRVERDLELRGTKHWVAINKKVLLTKGLRDERTILLIPEVKDGETTGINLLHISLHENLGIQEIRTVLNGYYNRYGAIQDAVRETEPSFRDDFLAEQSVEQLLIDSVDSVAERLRRFD